MALCMIGDVLNENPSGKHNLSAYEEEKKDPKNDIDNKTLINFRSFYVHDNVNMVKHRR